MVEDYGTLTADFENERKELKIINFLKCKFKDNRLASVCEIEDGTFVLAVENPPSSGRATQANIWLSKESLTGLMVTTLQYLNIKGDSIDELFLDAIQGDAFEYDLSDNLKDKQQ